VARGHENLIPLNKRSKEEQREISKKGAQAASRTYARRRKLRMILEDLMSQKDEVTGMDNDLAMCIALLAEAKAGNVKAFSEIRDTMGQKPKEEVESKEDVRVTYRVVRS